eukprot:TRINITY_DN15393_c0_g3_i1.p1 TRINITY_DN15393_c0_g3~~TRINITY_DN15393_c0_g3_i1.p1  ORF type:complete len:424 (-),score=63.54 TRINITY_DN15393_c0_g3_i1:135-1406(-)
MPSLLALSLGGAAGKLSISERLAHWTSSWTPGRTPPLQPQREAEDVAATRWDASVCRDVGAAASTSALTCKDAVPMVVEDLPAALAPPLRHREWAASCRIDSADPAAGASLQDWQRCSVAITTESLELCASAGCGFDFGGLGSSVGVSGYTKRACVIPLRHVVDVSIAPTASGGAVASSAVAVDPTSKIQGRGLASNGQPCASVTQTEAGGHSCLQNVKDTLSERSTFEGRTDTSCAGSSLCPAEVQSAEVESLVNGVETGGFDLPPIPLGRMPVTRSGLPSTRSAAVSGAHCSVPVGEFDGSNCHHQALAMPIPPFPAASCRLRVRTHRDMRSHRPIPELQPQALSSSAGLKTIPHDHVVVVWTSPSTHLARSSGQTRRLQQGVPVLVSLSSHEEAVDLEALLLELRAAQMSAPETRVLAKK